MHKKTPIFRSSRFFFQFWQKIPASSAKSDNFVTFCPGLEPLFCGLYTFSPIRNCRFKRGILDLRAKKLVCSCEIYLKSAVLRPVDIGILSEYNSESTKRKSPCPAGLSDGYRRSDVDDGMSAQRRAACLVVGGETVVFSRRSGGLFRKRASVPRIRRKTVAVPSAGTLCISFRNLCRIVVSRSAERKRVWNS